MRADQLRDLAALGLTPEQFGAVIEIMARRSSAAIRQARYEANKRGSDVRSDVTSDVSGGDIRGGTILEFKKVKKDNPPPPSVTSDVQEFFDAYNVCAQELGWGRADKLTKQRHAAIRRCIYESTGLERAFDHLNDLANSRHGREWGAGQNDRGWRIDIDYVIRASKWIQIIEGKFNDVQAKKG